MKIAGRAWGKSDLSFHFFFVRRATAVAAMPSPEPVKPRWSVVVAFTDTVSTDMDKTRAIFPRISEIKE